MVYYPYPEEFGIPRFNAIFSTRGLNLTGVQITRANLIRNITWKTTLRFPNQIHWRSLSFAMFASARMIQGVMGYLWFLVDILK